MAEISKISSLVAGIQRSIDLASNTLVVNDIKIGGASGTTLTESILQTLTDGSDAASLHNHDTQYYTQSQIASTADGSAGASLVGVDQTPAFTNISGADVQAMLESIDSALGSAAGSTFEDDNFRIQNSGDLTKQIQFDAANITTGNTRVITMPDAAVDLGDIATNTSDISTNTGNIATNAADILLRALDADVIKKDGSVAFTGEQSMGSNKLTNLAAPTNDNDAARLIDVQNAQAGVKVKTPVQLASDSNISDLATGAPANVDGEGVQLNDRILVTGQTDTTENGIYVVDTVGSGSDGQWSRATDFDGTPSSEVTLGATVFVNSGTSYANTNFILNDSDSPNDEIDVGTETQLWVIFSRAENINAGDGLDKSGLDLSVNATDLAGSGLENDGSNNIRIAAAAAGDGLTGGAGSALSVQADSTGGAGLATVINVSSNGLALQVDSAYFDDAGAGGGLRIVEEAISNSEIAAAAGIEVSKLAALTANNVVATDGSGFLTDTGVSPSELTTLTDGSNADSLHTHAQIKKTFVAGEAFAANTTHVVRMAINGETAGRVYRSDSDASSNDLFYAIGVIEGSGFAGVSAGANVEVTLLGEVTLGSSDTSFSSSDIGAAVHLSGIGGFDSLPNIGGSFNTDEASFRIAVIQSTSTMLVGNMQLLGIN